MLVWALTAYSIQDEEKLQTAQLLAGRGREAARELSAATAEASLTLAADPSPAAVLDALEAVSNAVHACLALEATLACLCISAKDAASAPAASPASPMENGDAGKKAAKPASALHD